ncbi:sodium-dependent bicarbonate transport family permease [bacterium]|nr:sodium-dependent bicarbonate transport family permease [bacterium]QQR56174.1 MAG: sodium-dependent bicarbonate transport family permease [Candidatus Melainabacteria bacterium]
MKNCKFRFSAVLITLYLLANFAGFFSSACWAASNAGSERLIESSIVTIYDGNPLIQLKPSKNSNGNDVALTVSPDLQVSLNGHKVLLNQLKPGDNVKAFVRSGSAFRIDATRKESGIIVGIDTDKVFVSNDYVSKEDFFTDTDCPIRLGGLKATWSDLKKGDKVEYARNDDDHLFFIEATRESPFEQFWFNFRTNLFKPLLLFFFVGLIIPLLNIPLEFPPAVYQGLTIYLLISVGWHGGEELAVLQGAEMQQAGIFMVIGFVTNFIVGCLAYLILRRFVTTLRRVDSATVAAYYGSDSAGTFLTCVGALQAARIVFAPYMPVMLAVMEIPGCLLGLYLVQQLKKRGMDKNGFMPDEKPADYIEPVPDVLQGDHHHDDPIAEEKRMALESNGHKKAPLMREVFLNPGLFLLMSGIVVGFISRLQGPKVVEMDDRFFVSLFQGILCLFLLEMGMTAGHRMHDLRNASWRFIAFGILSPNIFAVVALFVCHATSYIVHAPLQLGTYVLFMVLCGAASYIAVPAIQRLAIPEASPTLPLAASLGLTFVYNVTIGIPLYIFMAQQLLINFPVKF